MSVDEHTTTPVGCGSYDPGHLLHWHHWKQASAAECVAVVDVIQSGTSLEIVLAGEPSLRWYHHDPLALATALAGTQAPILVSRRHQAVRVDGFWFNCATDVRSLAACG